jgi:hypothetical protein
MQCDQKRGFDHGGLTFVSSWKPRSAFSKARLSLPMRRTKWIPSAFPWFWANHVVVESVRSGSDEYPHVTWTNSSNTLLQPFLTIRQVKGILGPLDAVMNEAIEGTPSLSEEYSLRNDPILRHFDLVHPTKREEELY